MYFSSFALAGYSSQGGSLMNSPTMPQYVGGSNNSSMCNNLSPVSTRIRLYLLFIVAQITQVTRPIWIALAWQYGQPGQE